MGPATRDYVLTIEDLPAFDVALPHGSSTILRIYGPQHNRTHLCRIHESGYVVSYDDSKRTFDTDWVAEVEAVEGWDDGD